MLNLHKRQPSLVHRIETVTKNAKKRISSSRIQVHMDDRINVRKTSLNKHLSINKTLSVNDKTRQRRRVKHCIKVVNQQQMRDIFVELMGCQSQKMDFLKPWKKSIQNFPKSLINTLYRQNVKNYNPYIETLNLLSGEEISLYQKQHITNLCYMGLAKSFLKTKKYAKGPTYSRVNVLIRTYMRDKMWEQVKQRSQNYENIIYIPTTELALSFNGKNYPHQVQDLYTPEQYQQIIVQVNKIICEEFIRFKASSNVFQGDSWYARGIFYSIVSLVFLFMLTEIGVLVTIILVLVVIWILLETVLCKLYLDRVVQSKSVTEIIMARIDKFFKIVNNERVEWKIGEDFYWLEIHYIKKKKKLFL